MTNNNQSNNIIKWVVIIFDFLILNLLLYFFRGHHVLVDKWPEDKWYIFLLGCNLALIISQLWFSTVVHQRLATAGEIVRRVLMLTFTQTILAYLILKTLTSDYPIGRILIILGPMLLLFILVSRAFERLIVKWFRRMGRNSRHVTFVGADSELMNIYMRLASDPTTGYHFIGYYADEEMALPEKHDGDERFKSVPELKRLGSLRYLLENLNNPDKIEKGDEMYVSVSRRERDTVKRLSDFCDQQVIRFYYVPVSVETLGMTLKREMVEDIEIYTTYENPLVNPLNKIIKRTFDLVLATVFLLVALPFFPIVALIIKWQSPGPIFFKQLRTGLDGRDFYCYKFRSMHVNKDADKVQATKNDPRKFPFGDFMRKANIDELPQFWNVLRGDMSIVGPRPHMLAHTEQYSQLIDKYMVRHFVKPGVTGWAQVTGFRGETRELWQMEGRVKRDIWYMEHWTIWLDIRIIWLTVKSMFIHDKNAY